MLNVYVTNDFAGMNVGISIVRTFTTHGLTAEPTHDRMILRVDQDDSGRQTTRWEDVPTGGAAIEPTYRLGQDEARALLDGLTRHFNGAEDTRALRRDYDHERKRVDQLMGSLTQIAGTLAEWSPAPAEAIRARP